MYGTISGVIGCVLWFSGCLKERGEKAGGRGRFYDDGVSYDRDWGYSSAVFPGTFVPWLLDKGLAGPIRSCVHRKANRLADGLANLTFSLPFGFHSFVVAPIEVAVLVHEDVAGPLRPRQTRFVS